MSSRVGAALIVVLLGIAVAGVLVGGSHGRDRAEDLDRRLRCPVCQSVSIADSPSQTAATMRREVADQVAAGRTDQQVVDYFRARYGDWVLLDPPARGDTLMLWLLLPAAAAVGVAVVLTRARPAAAVSAPSEAARLRVDRAIEQRRADGGEEGLP